MINDDRAEAAVRRCSVKKVLLENSQNSEENIYATVFFLIMLQVSGTGKKNLAQVVSCDFENFRRASFWLLLKECYLLYAQIKIHSPYTFYMLHFRHTHGDSIIDQSKQAIKTSIYVPLIISKQNQT